MKLKDIMIGGALGIVSGVVLAQFMDLIPAVVVGVIAGVSVAFASRTTTSSSEG
ncbi:hypothetical protein F7P69_13295 [Cellulosimicrobium funkei]|nr:hypothetical protein [Cellulosimicrobium funkei]